MPVIKAESLRLLLAFANANNYKIQPIDVDTVFLHAPLNKETYVMQPEGFIDKEHPDYICLLHKSLYGLKQAPMEWYKMIDTHLCANSYEPMDADPCLYIKYHQGLISFIGLYVDDCTIITHHSKVRLIKDMICQ
jgi:hypothetical protein